MSERIPQYLLKRNPALTKEEFAAAWRHHAELVTPYFLSGKISYYAQVLSFFHSPHLSLSLSLPFAYNSVLIRKYRFAAHFVEGKKKQMGT